MQTLTRLLMNSSLFLKGFKTWGRTDLKKKKGVRVRGTQRKGYLCLVGSWKESVCLLTNFDSVRRPDLKGLRILRQESYYKDIKGTDLKLMNKTSPKFYVQKYRRK